MALLFCDSFDHYDTAHFSEKWDNSGGLIGPFGRESNGLQLTSFCTKNFVSAATVVVGFALLVPQSDGFELVLRQSNSNQIVLRTGGNGELGLADPSGVVLATSPAGSIRFGIFQYVELLVTFTETATGTATIRVNGTVVVTATNIRTAFVTPPMADSLLVECTNGNVVIDDIYICNGLGSLNNTFLGDVKIKVLLPNGNGRLSQFNRTGGTSAGNFTAVNQVPPPNDASFVSSATPSQEDAYAVTSIGTVSAVVAVQLVASARKDDAGSRVLQLGFGNGTVENFDTGTSLSSNYVMLTRELDQNPITRAPWQVADLTGSQIALKVGS